MMTSLLLYFLVFTILVKGPRKMWDYPLILAKTLAPYLKIKATNSLVSRGESLLALFSQLESNASHGINVIKEEISDYKFFTILVLNLIDYQRKLGLGLKTILPDIRKNLIIDIRFEKKIKSHKLAAYYQFILITLMSWFFVFFSGQIINYTPRASLLFLILSLQVIGFILFGLGLSWLRQKIFSKFDSLIEALYLFITLIEVGLGISQVLSHSKILEDYHFGPKDFVSIHVRLKILIERWKAMGLSPKIEAQEILEDLWELKNTFFERYLKFVDGFKFTILVIFFMPAYFLYLYSIFQFFMEQ